MVLCRHANSRYNFAFEHEYKSDSSNDNLLDVMTRPSLRDCTLSMLGYEQAVYASKYAHKFKVHTVYVSPLVRAIETAYFLFKDHPDKPKLKVVPLMREHLHSVCDIPSSISLIEARFKKGVLEMDFSMFDSFPDREHWFMETY